MIDVWGVAANALWVLGLAVVLAALSWAHWVAQEEGVRLRRVLSRRGLRWPLDVGLLLFCAGLAATSRRWWERALWGVLALAWGVQAGSAAWGQRGAGDVEESS